MILRHLRYIKNLITTKKMKNVVTIVGTTGVGKSQFSIELAKSINGEIINADSMQVYRGAPIISNKHPLDEREGIAHHVMDHIPWNEEYFIHRYSAEAVSAIDDIHARGKTPIIIGGTHYYLQNLLFKNKTIGEKEEKEKLIPLTQEQQDLLDGPVEAIFEALTNVDPVISEKFHPKDTRKLRRALEIYYTTGQKPSEMYHEQKLDELEDTSLKYNTLLFWIYCDPEILKLRLDQRVDSMMGAGALDEIRELNQFYESQTLPPDMTKGIWQVIGYKEFRPWLTGGQTDTKLFEEGVERMKIRTRQYAKYQVKWIRKLLGVELNKESRFGFKYGGKMYLLDATDLSKWATDVRARGLSIVDQFIAKGPLGVTEAQAPEKLREIFPSSEFYEEFNSNKTIKAVENWKHFECPVCKDSQGSPLVAVGEDNWSIHQKSRRHKKQISYNQNKRKHEELLKKYKKVKEDILQ
ncbi:tRNA isopentenyltransferase [Metschnikowia bicuspidata var. bicuspidata NRRL YB-4993]|uniref:tRNA dimethylallyltransferase n=1 Tax=Metschnikowia bicuspidata var. bicuspidata NRRL YB-4993 TaxID=869754 RepID=A0A1A0H8C5_9ASCO|nr:tRNA isopentenyltransferase [Metschnikowia bicuspidata var. bicuspidata NRRL YB-4993]OBA20364.1 tRNA isopentenyltransferase [Metschnikowia bicuspidata var. bicuspidata NRRL YB-4993]